MVKQAQILLQITCFFSPRKLAGISRISESDKNLNLLPLTMFIIYLKSASRLEFLNWTYWSWVGNGALWTFFPVKIKYNSSERKGMKGARSRRYVSKHKSMVRETGNVAVSSSFQSMTGAKLLYRTGLTASWNTVNNPFFFSASLQFFFPTFITQSNSLHFVPPKLSFIENF